jgi:methyl-accepting chemotaxis protein
VDQINRGTRQVATAAQRVSSGAETVANASSKQMATLNETVTMLTAVLNTVSENTEKARQTETFVLKSEHLVADATEAMNALTVSMEEIEASEEETANIVNDIDRVAFETNLLALNAAVEAARAGEAGEGFAVVAEHVRSLAKEAARAAGNSAELIEETTRKVRGGTALTIKAREVFLNVTEQTTRFAAFAKEISNASSHQAASIGEINRSVSELQKISRHYTAFAEESAMASQRMLDEVVEMAETAERLSAVIGMSVPMEMEKNSAKAERTDGAPESLVTVLGEMPPLSMRREGDEGHRLAQPGQLPPYRKNKKTENVLSAA